MIKKILHANDGSDGAFKALRMALDLAKRYGAELHMTCVEELVNFPEMLEEVKQEKSAADRLFSDVVKRAQAMAAKVGLALHPHVLTGHPVRTIADFALSGKFDLLVIGATGHSIVFQTMIGSRADRLVHMAPCPVLVVK